MIPNGWEIKKMSDVVIWGSGGTPKATEAAYYENGTIPWLVIGDLNDGVVNSSASKITELGLKNSSAKLIPPGTLLVAMYGSIGKLGITGIESMIAEMTDILKLAANMQKVGIKINGAGQDTKQYENILKSIQVLFAGEEILYETESFAITGNILDENLYQGTRSDLINAKLTCLAQVKRVYPDGTELMKNTIFTKIKDASAKDKLITSMQALTSGNVFDFEATAVSSIYEKPVYQLEIIALYQ